MVGGREINFDRREGNGIMYFGKGYMVRGGKLNLCGDKMVGDE